MAIYYKQSKPKGATELESSDKKPEQKKVLFGALYNANGHSLTCAGGADMLKLGDREFKMNCGCNSKSRRVKG